MGDLNVNKISANNEKNAGEKPAIKPEEDVNSVFLENAAPKDDGKIGTGFFATQKGELNGKKFSLDRERRLIGGSYSITGEYGDKKIDIIEKPKGIFTSTVLFNGKIGDDDFTMQSSNQGLFKSGTVYKGSYKGKSFSVVEDNRGILNGGERIIEGKYGDEKIHIVRDPNLLGKDDIDAKNLPEDFEPIAVIIMTRRADKARREEMQRQLDENNTNY